MGLLENLYGVDETGAIFYGSKLSAEQVKDIKHRINISSICDMCEEPGAGKFCQHCGGLMHKPKGSLDEYVLYGYGKHGETDYCKIHNCDYTYYAIVKASLIEADAAFIESRIRKQPEWDDRLLDFSDVLTMGFFEPSWHLVAWLS